MKVRPGDEQGEGFSLRGSAGRLLEETKSGALPSLVVGFAGPSRRFARRPPRAAPPGVPRVVSIRSGGSARPARPRPGHPPVPSLSILGLLSPPRASELPCPIPGNTRPLPRKLRECIILGLLRAAGKQTKTAERPGEAGEGLAAPSGQVGRGVR